MVNYAGRVEARMTIPTGGAAVSATNSGGGPTTVTVAAGSYYLTAAGGVSSLISTLQTQLNATRTPSNWTVSLSTTTGLVTINCTGTWSLAWTSTALRDVLGFAADITSVSSAQTGTQQARGVWLPDCPLTLEGDLKRAPTVSDSRSAMSPTGNVITLVGNTYRRQRSLMWSHVPIAQVWGAQATYTNGSWEEFFRESQLGLGSSWFSPGSPIQVYDHQGNMLGSDATIAGWSMIGLTSVEPKKAITNWTGLWQIEVPQIVAVGP